MKSWLSSPLATNYLLSLCKNGPSYQKKYLQLFKDLKIKDGFISKTQLFISPSYNAEKNYDTSGFSIEKVEFEKNHDVVTKWINQNGRFSGKDMKNYILPTSTSLLCNISLYKGVWKCSQPSYIMKVYNSFSYTDDIKYEARLLELPMQDDDFKLVIIVPNEVSSIHTVFNKLVEEGLAAAVACVHPLFTFSTPLEAPSIVFSSQNHIPCNEKFQSSGEKCDNFNVAQIGNVVINENGTNISVLTLLSSEPKTSIILDEQSRQESPFYFAFLYKDIAVFTGLYMKRV